jgi:RNA-directed DNA polymerase
VVKQKTAAARLSRTLRRIDDWCREHRHDSLPEQHQSLTKKLMGRYQYFGITGNIRMLVKLYQRARRIWHKWLSRRSRKAPKSWDWMERLLARQPLPRPRIVHSYLTRVANP